MYISPKLYTILGTYTRAFVAAMVTSYSLGNTSLKVLFTAGMASIIPVIMRWANPADTFPAPNKALTTANEMTDSVL